LAENLSTYGAGMNSSKKPNPKFKLIDLFGESYRIQAERNRLLNLQKTINYTLIVLFIFIAPFTEYWILEDIESSVLKKSLLMTNIVISSFSVCYILTKVIGKLFNNIRKKKGVPAEDA
jgi:hypothetical protein